MKRRDAGSDRARSLAGQRGAALLVGISVLVTGCQIGRVGHVHLRTAPRRLCRESLERMVECPTHDSPCRVVRRQCAGAHELLGCLRAGVNQWRRGRTCFAESGGGAIEIKVGPAQRQNLALTPAGRDGEDAAPRTAHPRWRLDTRRSGPLVCYRIEANIRSVVVLSRAGDSFTSS